LELLGAVCKSIIVAMLTIFATADPLQAKIVGVEISISIMFLINDVYTFSNEGKSRLRNRITRWIRSHIVRSGGIIVSFSVLWVLTTQIGVQIVLYGADFWPTIANLIGIGFALMINYTAESLFTWKVHE
jgi:putative flippase GtrA